MRSASVLIKEVADALAALAEIDPASMVDGELADAVVELQRMRNQLDAVATSVTGVFDARMVWAPEGARSASAWMAWRCRVPKARASHEVSNARALRHMPVVEAAFSRGDIGADHVRILAHSREVNTEKFAQHERELRDLACAHTYNRFTYVMRYWRYRADPDGEERAARMRYEDRHAHCSETFNGARVLDAEFDPVGGAIFATELERIVQEMFEADWAEAKERLGQTPSVPDLCRRPAQRRADAIVEMARRSAAMPADARPVRPLITVLTGEESLARICELSTGTVVTPGDVLPLLRDCDVERIVFDGPSRVIDVGARRRLFVGATRRAVEVRDRRCTHPSCDVMADKCEVDHIEPYESGGLTVQDNGRLRCAFHNRFRQRRTRPPP
jgi:hypothetical protein